MVFFLPVCLAIVGLASRASAHVAFWSNAMYGFNVTDHTYSYDNRPQVPVAGMTFDQWWMHGHIDHPPNSGDYFELPAGGKVNTELSCDKGATSWYNSSQGGDAGYGVNFACPGAEPSAIHATGINDVTGCALAIAYQPDVNALKPDDFVIFSVNHTCPWYLNTEFEIPNLPACPEGGCHCAWFWIHSFDSGSEQMYMNGFKCKVTGNAGTKPLGKPAVPRRCGPDSAHGKPNGTPGNCTVGAKLPMYWYQKEGNNMFEDTYMAPYYNLLYGFNDGAQHDVFDNGVIASLAAYTSTPSTATHASTPTTQTQPATSTTLPVEKPTSSSVISSIPTSAASSSKPPNSTKSSPTATKSPLNSPNATKSSSMSPSSISSSSISTASPSKSTSKCKPRKSKRNLKAKQKHSRYSVGLHH